eukprot:2525984-Ditylum_brightwellii.AAC.1
MQHLYHNPNQLIMFPCKPPSSQHLETHFGHGAAEIHTAYNSFIKNHNDANLACNLMERCSVTSAVHLIDGVAYWWSVKKQVKPAANTTVSETRSLYTGVMQTDTD